MTWTNKRLGQARDSDKRETRTCKRLGKQENPQIRSKRFGQTRDSDDSDKQENRTTTLLGSLVAPRHVPAGAATAADEGATGGLGQRGGGGGPPHLLNLDGAVLHHDALDRHLLDHLPHRLPLHHPAAPPPGWAARRSVKGKGRAGCV